MFEKQPRAICVPVVASEVEGALACQVFCGDRNDARRQEAPHLIDRLVTHSRMKRIFVLERVLLVVVAVLIVSIVSVLRSHLLLAEAVKRRMG